MDYRGNSCTARDGKTREHSKLCRQRPRIDLPWNGFYAFYWLLSGFIFQPEDLLFPTSKLTRSLIAAFVVTLSILNTILDIPLIYYSSLLPNPSLKKLFPLMRKRCQLICFNITQRAAVFVPA